MACNAHNDNYRNRMYVLFILHKPIIIKKLYSFILLIMGEILPHVSQKSIANKAHSEQPTYAYSNCLLPQHNIS